MEKDTGTKTYVHTESKYLICDLDVMDNDSSIFRLKIQRKSQNLKEDVVKTFNLGIITTALTVLTVFH